jgi:glutamine amidotransferase
MGTHLRGAVVVSIIDYGMGNLRSVRNALMYLGIESRLSQDPEQLLSSTHLILPGVGSFTEAMRNLSDLRLVEPIKTAGARGMPVLGICLGMQLLADEGDEGGVSSGIGLIPGRVTRLDDWAGTLKIPHMGFNQVCGRLDHPLLTHIRNESDFYFAHSYQFLCRDEHTVATTTYGSQFASIVCRRNVCGAQFHPEKSQSHGLTFLRNFCETPGC